MSASFLKQQDEHIPLLGATTDLGSSNGFIAAWMALVGLGMGLTMATAASAALSTLPQERSGVGGSAVMQAIQKIGAPFGAALLGSVLSSAYQSQVNLVGLPSAVANVAKESLFGELAVALKLGSAPLLESVRTAFVSGFKRSLLFCKATIFFSSSARGFSNSRS